MIDSRQEHIETTYVSKVECKSEPWVNGDAERNSDTRTSLVDSLLREDSEGRSHLYGVDWACRDVMNGTSQKTVKVGDLRSYNAVERGIEAGRFREATDVLARHYGSGTQKTTDNNISQRRRHYNYHDDDEEIKV